MTDDWKTRLTRSLEPVLREKDPRPGISAYHDMPYAIFRYAPQDEFPVRQEVSLLRTRLEQAGKRVTVISLAECLDAALEAEDLDTEALIEAETTVGLEDTIETVAEVISSYQPLDDLVADRLPADPEPTRDVPGVNYISSACSWPRASPPPCSPRGTNCRPTSTRPGSQPPRSPTWTTSTASSEA